MFCWRRKEKVQQLEQDDVTDDPPLSTNAPGSSNTPTAHDYIYSPKDFCDISHQKKLNPEYYGQDESPAPDEASSSVNELTTSSSRERLRGSLKLTDIDGSDLQVPQPQQTEDERRSPQNLRRSQGDLRRSKGDLRRSKPDLRKSQTVNEPMTRSARFSNFFSSTSYTNINYYEEFCQLFPHLAVVPMDGYRVELGGRVSPGQELFLQEQDAYNLSYQKIFQKNDHYNFVGGDASNPFIVSLLVCDDVQGGCRTIVRTKYRDYHIIVPHSAAPVKMARAALAQVRKSDSSIPKEITKITDIKGQFIVKDIANFEDKNFKSRHKVGILYSTKGQTTEEEMFANCDPSPEFIEFLDTIGERVRLRGFPTTKFVGGLDPKNDMTGTESYYTELDNLEIMFHVSTLLPFTADRSVQVERKKHIGNDVVCIVFMDSPTPFRPNTITSKFIHVVIVVQFLERDAENRPVYRVSVASKPGVEPHSPVLPTPPHFAGGPDFRLFLLTKAVNAERAAMHAPSFKLTRTRMNGLATIVEKHLEEAPKKGCFG